MKKLIFLFGLLVMSTFGFAQTEQDSILISIDQAQVVGTRATELTPVTKLDIDRAELEATAFSQPLTMYLQNTPSVTAYSDGGHGFGYAYFRLRGIDQTRINMTLNGVPLNEPEDQGVYFSNYPDFMNSIRSMQIQRGTGTSANGTASYAGSINFQSENGTQRDTELQFGWGSFNTRRFSAEHSTGLNNKTATYLRYSKYSSDGFRDNSGGEGNSFFLNTGYYGDKNTLVLTAFTGRSENQMAWFAVNEADIEVDPTTNYNTASETDAFQQSLAMLKYTHYASDNVNLSATGYYNRLDGDWRLDLENLGIDSAGVYNYNLSSDFYGFIGNVNWNVNNFELNGGVHANTYSRNHQGATVPRLDNPDYSNTGTKNEISGYVKIQYTNNDVTYFADIQSRDVRFTYDGDYDAPDFNWGFINPRAGVRYEMNESNQLYASIGTSGREPTRTDLFMGEDNPSDHIALSPEQVTDYEIGYGYRSSRVNVGVNAFYMDFENELALAGELGTNALPLMQQVDQSYRTGVELTGKVGLGENFALVNNSSYIYAQINDDNIEGSLTPVLTPDVIVNQDVVYLRDNWRIGVGARYQSESYLDFNNDFTVPSFVVVNTFAEYSNNFFTLNFKVNNITDQEYFVSGYVEPGIADGNLQRSLYANPGVNFFTSLILNL